MRRISKRVREKAIMALEVAAHWSLGNGSPGSAWADSGARQFAHEGSRADQLVDDALNEAPTDPDGWMNEFSWLEAAALLRDGWSAGDPVVRL